MTTDEWGHIFYPNEFNFEKSLLLMSSMVRYNDLRYISFIFFIIFRCLDDLGLNSFTRDSTNLNRRESNLCGEHKTSEWYIAASEKVFELYNFQLEY